jgi:membrane-associated phospholipid phosphatase
MVRRRPVALDERIVRAFAAHRYPRASRAIALFGSKEARAGLSVLSALLMRRRRRRAIRMLATGVAIAGAEALIKRVTDRPRPEPPLRIEETKSSSYPSGHAMTGALAWTAASALPRDMRTPVRALSLLAGVATGVGRVALGAHWPTDLVGGALVGVGVAKLIDAVLPDRRTPRLRARLGM